MTKKIINIFIFCLILLIPIHAEASSMEASIIEENYSKVLQQWENLPKVKDFSFTVPTYIPSDTAMWEEDLFGYGRKTIRLKKGESIKFEVNVPQEGLYEISIAYYPISSGLIPIRAQLKVNDVYQYHESKMILFPVLWENKTTEFEVSRKGDEIVPMQNQIASWQRLSVRDSSFLEPENLLFHLKQGLNTIELIGNNGEMLLGDISITSPKTLPSYKEYQKQQKSQYPTEKLLLVAEGEKNTYKNTTAIRQIAMKEPEAVPYEPTHLLLNVFGGPAWKESGQAVQYAFDVPEDGFYRLAFKVKQDIKIGSTIYRRITIDGDVPFQEAKSFRFSKIPAWTTVNFGDANGSYEVFLTKGKHLIGFEADASPNNEFIKVLEDMLLDLNNKTMEIRKLVGTNDDPYRDWTITDYMPTITDELVTMALTIENQLEKAYERNDGNKKGEEFNKLKICIEKLYALAEKPDRLPITYKQLSTGSSSIGQLIGDSITIIKSQPLYIDQIYLYSKGASLPTYQVSWVKKLSDNLLRFFSTFEAQEEKETNKMVLNVWMNRSRPYVDVLQKLADEDFTKKTNVKVNISLVTSEQKLVLSNAAGNPPNVALGIGSGQPYEFALRNSAQSLSEFATFPEVIKRFSPGALLTFIKDEEVYGLPETQDFYVTMYRTDILSKLNLAVPEQWEDVLAMLPELQRYGMNFYHPLSVNSAAKPFTHTAPFIHQFRGTIYDQEAQVALSSEEALTGIKLMTDIFTVYGMPLQVPSFYNHFRYGTLPIGVSNLADYLKLTYAAPEIAGLWQIAPSPGVLREDGELSRWTISAGQATMIFKKNAMPNESWDFVDWWLSEETQLNFATQMQNMYGKEYFWNTANLEAFKKLPIEEEHKEVILQQWEYLFEVPKLPGGYMVERELSNVWNKIVFNDENPRYAIDNSIVIMSREIRRKLEEFDYYKDSVKVKDYIVPTIESVKKWGAGNE